MPGGEGDEEEETRKDLIVNSEGLMANFDFTPLVPQSVKKKEEEEKEERKGELLSEIVPQGAIETGKGNGVKSRSHQSGKG